eukprot:3757472-Prymnesium_polylepis.1
MGDTSRHQPIILLPLQPTSPRLLVDFAQKQNGLNRRVDPMARYEVGVPHSVLCGERFITRPTSWLGCALSTWSTSAVPNGTTHMPATAAWPKVALLSKLATPRRRQST